MGGGAGAESFAWDARGSGLSGEGGTSAGWTRSAARAEKAQVRTVTLLRGDLQPRQQASNRRQTQRDPEAPADQLRDDAARPQAEIEAVLPRDFPADPRPHLAPLRIAQFESRTGVLAGLERRFAASIGGLQPRVDCGPAEAVACDDGAGRLAFSQPTNRYQSDRFADFVGERAAVDSHATSYVPKADQCSLNRGSLSKA